MMLPLSFYIHLLAKTSCGSRCHIIVRVPQFVCRHTIILYLNLYAAGFLYCCPLVSYVPLPS